MLDLYSQRLTRWATGFVLAACLALGLGGLMPEYYAYHATFEAAEGRTKTLARLFAQHAEDTFAVADSGLVAIRGMIESGREPTEVLESMRLLETQGPQVVRSQAVVIAGADGIVRASSAPAPSMAGPSNISDYQHFRDHVRSTNRDLHIGLPSFDAQTRRWTLSLSRRLERDDGTFDGVVYAVMHLDWFTRFFAEATAGENLIVKLARDDAALLARHPLVETALGMPVEAPDVFQSLTVATPSGHHYGFSAVDGINRLVSWRVGAEYGIVAGVAVAIDDIVAGWRTGALERTLPRIAFTIVFGGFGVWGVRQLRRQGRLTVSLAEREAEFRALAEGSRDAILRLDAEGVIRYASPAALALFGRAPEVLIGRHVSELAANDDVASVLRTLGGIDPAGGGTTIGFRHDGEEDRRRWYAMAVQAAPRDGDFGFVATVRDETDEHEREVALARQAVTDPLTGLANRRRFDEALAGEWRRAGRTAAPLSLLFFDADRFKLYNDTYGHAQGDLCLIALARTIRTTAGRAGDLAARFGGEEFVLLLPETDLTGALALAERIRAAVEALAMPHTGNPPRDVVTVSIGVATAHPGGVPAPEAEDLVRRADAALYRAKSGGRNRVVAALPNGVQQSA